MQAIAGWTMGLSRVDLDLLIRLKQNGHIPDRTSVIEIGAQQLSNSLLENRPKVEKLGRLFGAAPPAPLSAPAMSYVIHGTEEHQPETAPLARDFWKWLGFEYASIDIDGSPYSIPVDLNYDDVPQDARGKYHLVTNFGTTEHVANQLNAFKVIHDLTAVGGIMLHNLPSQGMLNHGLVNYNPKFFWMLARSNGYKWLYFDYLSAAVYYELPENIVDLVAPFNSDIAERRRDYKVADGTLIIALQKVHDIAFVAPLDINTGSRINNAVVEERYWTVFRPGAFNRLNRIGKLKFWLAQFWRRLRVPNALRYRAAPAPNKSTNGQ